MKNESESCSVVSDSLFMELSRPEYLLEWVAFPFSRGSSQLRDSTRSSTLQVNSLPAEPQGKPKTIGVGSLSPLQGIFPTQELNWGVLHCRRTLYQLSSQGSPCIYIYTYIFCLFRYKKTHLKEYFIFQIKSLFQC